MIYTKYNDDINIQSSYVAYNTSTYPFRSLKIYSCSTRGKWMIPRMYLISCLSFTQSHLSEIFTLLDRKAMVNFIYHLELLY